MKNCLKENCSECKDLQECEKFETVLKDLALDQVLIVEEASTSDLALFSKEK